MHNQSLSIHNQCLSKITVMRWNEIKLVVQAVFNPDFRSVASFKQTKSWTHVEAHPSWEKEIKATNQPRSETSGRKSGWDCIEEGSSHGLYRCQKTWVQLNFQIFLYFYVCVNHLNNLREKYVGLLCDLNVDPKWGLNIALRESWMPRTCEIPMLYNSKSFNSKQFAKFARFLLQRRLSAGCFKFLQHVSTQDVSGVKFSQHGASCEDRHNIPLPSIPLWQAVPLHRQLLDGPQSRP